MPAFIYINVNLTRITGVLGIADIAGKRTYTNTMLDGTGDNLVPGVPSPYDVGKLSLPRVLSSDWSISISVALTVCQEARDTGTKIMAVMSADKTLCFSVSLLLPVHNR